MRKIQISVIIQRLPCVTTTVEIILSLGSENRRSPCRFPRTYLLCKLWLRVKEANTERDYIDVQAFC